MARFYGTVQGARGPASRLGHQDLYVTAQSYAGDVTVGMERDSDDNEIVTINCRSHGGGGKGYCLYRGKVADLLNQDKRFAKLQALGIEEFMRAHERKHHES